MHINLRVYTSSSDNNISLRKRAVELPITLGKRDNTKTPKVLVTLFT